MSSRAIDGGLDLDDVKFFLKNSAPILLVISIFFIISLVSLIAVNSFNQSPYFVAISNDCSQAGGELFLEKGFFLSNVGCEIKGFTNYGDSVSVRYFYCPVADGFAYSKSVNGVC